MSELELAPAPAPVPVTLFHSNEPDEVITQAAKTANALAQVVEKRKLTVSIQGRRHVLVEGWTLLGTMLGVFPVLEWSRQLENGWEARVVAKTLDGRTVGAAEAMCLRSERTWAKRDDYALRSMAQTRATSKALRQPLGFVMTMAGFEATPAEEMTLEAERPPEKPLSVSSAAVVAAAPVADPPSPAPAAPNDEGERASSKQVSMIYRLVSKLDTAGLVEREKMLEAVAKEYGCEVRDLSKRQASDLITRLKLKAGEE